MGLTCSYGRQMFEGEDLSAADRAKAQMAQCKDWWDQQAMEKAALKVNRALPLPRRLCWSGS